MGEHFAALGEKRFFPSRVRDIYNAHDLEISLSCSVFGKYTLIPI